MSELLLLRHGAAEDHGVRPDAERDLVARGEGQARDAGRALAILGLVPDVVLASPKVRAWRTAELAGEALDRAPVRHDALLALDRDEALLAAALGPRVLLVGHEPDLSQVVHDLTGARCRMRKGGLAVLELAGGGGELQALLRPAELRAIAAAA
ncbi:histidine phosphatase family protein [Patulibacter brassicae]|uniref:Histidine phosphatase family protein n=1 Tax=Patulibacter brassicae TaxID=1705717 RepID=A0ABU4VM89_9ACTN|nr:histidine phosphatase family protein [Patulibacter brassicae]MDX8152013.1 histidine phosphatase family protein [Patulibacter brassicae]